jgi:hypothetical protein
LPPGGGGGGVQPPLLLLELPPPVQPHLPELPLPALQLLEAALPDLAPPYPLARLEPPLPPETNSISSKVKILITLSNLKMLLNTKIDCKLLVNLLGIRPEFFICVNMKHVNS